MALSDAVSSEAAPRPAPKPVFERLPAGRQTAIGLSLAAVILAAWGAVHVGAIFLADWSGGQGLGGWLRALPVILPLMLLQTWLSVGLFIIAHDAMHGSLAPGRPAVNRAAGSLALALYAAFPYSQLFESHHAHHRHAGTADDPDFDAEHPTRFWPWYLGFFWRYFTLRQFWVLTALLVVYLGVLGWRWPNVFLFWAIPSIGASLQLFYFGTFLPHRHEEGASFADRHNARTNEYGHLASLLTCFHFGYHHEHHDAPYVPWWRLPAYRAAKAQAPPGAAVLASRGA